MKSLEKSVLGTVMAGTLLLGGGTLPAQAAEAVGASGGDIVGNGTAVRGTYTVDCDFAGQRIAASINVIQGKGQTINSNGIQYETTCTSDGRETYDFLVFAEDRKYTPGPATIRVGVFYSDESGNYTGVEDIEAFPVKLKNSR